MCVASSEVRLLDSWTVKVSSRTKHFLLALLIEMPHRVITCLFVDFDFCFRFLEDLICGEMKSNSRTYTWFFKFKLFWECFGVFFPKYSEIDFRFSPTESHSTCFIVFVTHNIIGKKERRKTLNRGETSEQVIGRNISFRYKALCTFWDNSKMNQ